VSHLARRPRIDGTAASGLIDFLAGTRAADDGTRADFVTLDAKGDPRVGMIGGSYGGAIQLATAAVDHRVDALVPLITWNDLAYSLDPNNAVGEGGWTVPGAFKWQWANSFYLTGETQPLTVPSLDPTRINSLTCLHFVTRACAMFRTLNSGSYPAKATADLLAYMRSVSPVSYLNRVKAPTLLVQGQADSLFNLNEATATYKTLKAHGTTAKMIWQSLGHSSGTTAPAAGELDLSQGDLESSYVGRRILAWFDRYLLRRTNTDTGPAFAYYRDWITDPADTYATANQLPALDEKLYLSGDGKLVDNRAKVARGSRDYANRLVPTSHSESSLGGTDRPAGPGAVRHGGHVPGLDRRTPDADDGCRRRSEGDAQGRLPGGAAHPELRRRRRQPGPLRQALRSRPRRHQHPCPPVGRPCPRAGRHEELHGHPAGDRAPVRQGAPAAVRDRGERRRVHREPGDQAGDGGQLAAGHGGAGAAGRRGLSLTVRDGRFGLTLEA
jgi:dienelactone hydrolase